MKVKVLKPFGLRSIIGEVIDYDEQKYEGSNSSAKWLEENGYVEIIKEDNKCHS